MLLGQELKTIFRWYNKKEKQYRFMPNCLNECWFKLFMPYNSLLPFQIRQPTNGLDEWSGDILYWEIFTLSDVLAHDLTAYKGEIITFKSAGARYLTYVGNLPMESMQQGYYYSVITLATGGQFFSEVFFVDRAVGQEYLKLKWWSGCDIGDIIYSYGGFFNEMWLQAPIARNEPSLSEEGIENGKKEFLPTIQIYTDNFTFDEWVPEYVVAAMTTINMHDSIFIAEQYANDVFQRVQNFKSNFDWTGTDCHAVITCKFQRDRPIMKSRCCDNQPVTPDPAFAVSTLSGVAMQYGFFLGDGLGYKVQFVVDDETKITEVEIRGDFNRTGDEIVVVPYYQTETFIPAGFGFDISLEVTPVRVINDRLRMKGTTVLVRGTPS
jgi:hypothetical protein